MSDRSGSWRTCVGCREVERPTVLLRVVANRLGETGSVAPNASGIVEVVPDPRRRSPGRGAWIHPDLGCLHQAERRRAFGRALRVAAGMQIDTQHVRAFLNQRDAETREQVDPS